MRVFRFALGGVFWFMIWFPLGIMYVVEGNEDAKIVRFIATLEGIWNFIN